MGSISVASAQTTSPAGQEATKANDPINANAKTMKKKAQDEEKHDEIRRRHGDGWNEERYQVDSGSR